MYKEFYITFRTVNYVNVITGVYTIEPNDVNIKYTRIMFKEEDIPFLRITRLCTYNENENTSNSYINIKYLHSIGQALDIHPEFGSNISENTQKQIELGYFRNINIDSLRPFSYDCIRIIKEPTTHIFSTIIRKIGSIALIYEKVSRHSLELDVLNDNGLFKEYTPYLWGLILKNGLNAIDTAQPCIQAFSNQMFVNYDSTKFIMKEIVAINYMNTQKINHTFYAISNQYACEGVVYTDNPQIYKDKGFILSNQIEMNIIYDDGILNV